MNQEIIANRIKSFLVQQFPATKNVSNDEFLLNIGLIDSLGVLELVAFMEKSFGIIISDEDLLPENFGSISSMLKFVQQKRRRELMPKAPRQ